MASQTCYCQSSERSRRGRREKGKDMQELPLLDSFLCAGMMFYKMSLRKLLTSVRG